MKGVVFTFDALFALLIVAATVPLLLALSVPAETRQSSLGPATDSALAALSSVSIREVFREPVIFDLYQSGALSDADLDRPVLDVVIDFWASNASVNFTRAQNITEHLFSGLLPSTAKWSITLEDDVLFDTGGNTTKISATGRRVASGFMKGQNSSGYVAGLFLTAITSKRTAAYFFFGGFVGQGNTTAPIPVPENASIFDVYLELNAGDNFTLSFNGRPCANMTIIPGNFSVGNWTITDPGCLANLGAGMTNNISVNFVGGNITTQYIGGGYVKVSYTTAQLVEDDAGTYIFAFPGIRGLINLYDSFYVPGTINSMTANVSFFSGANYTTLLLIGNATVLNHSGTGQNVTVTINNTAFQQALGAQNMSLNSISSATVPVRMLVAANITSGTINGSVDVVLITDTSGSMAWRLNQDGVNGVVINDCNNPSIYSSTTARISLAKCLDKSFVNAILGGNASACGEGTPIVGNRVALVSFSTSANTFENLTGNLTYLESRINAYAAAGSTCISCAINRAYEILANQSGANRTKYIVLMTDGQANYRSTLTCYDFMDVSENVTAGVTGATAAEGPAWLPSNVGGTVDDLNSISMLNSTFGRAGANGGEIYAWNGSVWTLDVDTGADDVFGIDLLNQTFGFAVGENGRIWRWNGVSWTNVYNATGGDTLRSVDFLNATWAIAVGYNGFSGGRIHRWNGTTWAGYQNISGFGIGLYGVAIYNRTFGFASGSSGRIYQWNGTTFTQIIDTGSSIHHDVAFINGTAAFTASDDGRIYRWNVTTWTSTALSPGDLRGVHVVNTTLAYAVGIAGSDIYEWNGTGWRGVVWPYYYQGTNTTGLNCNDDDSCVLNISQSFSALNANYSAGRARTLLPNLTIDSVGFGPIGTCTLGNQTVHEIATTGNGTAYTSSDGSELSQIYCQIAANILTRTTQTQQVIPQGELFPAELYAESTIWFNYTSSTPPASYQEITIRDETPRFANCSGSFFPAPGINITEALRTSYSGFFWTRTAYINNSASGGLQTIFNLSIYGRKYENFGDPFKVYLPQILVYNESNTIRTELGFNTTHINPSCSSSDRIIYAGRIRAAVPYGNVFPELTGRVVRTYYDADHDGTSDGYIDLVIGGGLASFDPSVRTVDQLVGTPNALDDAILRLLQELNFVTWPGNSGVAGTATNPVDIRLSDLNITTTATGGIPFAWGPIDIRLDVRI